MQSKYPRADHTRVYIPMPGTEKEPLPDWMQPEVLAVPVFREVRVERGCAFPTARRIAPGDACARRFRDSQGSHGWIDFHVMGCISWLGRMGWVARCLHGILLAARSGSFCSRHGQQRPLTLRKVCGPPAPAAPITPPCCCILRDQIRRKIDDESCSLKRRIREDGTLCLPYSGMTGTAAKLLRVALEGLEWLQTLDLTGNPLGQGRHSAPGAFQ